MLLSDDLTMLVDWNGMVAATVSTIDSVTLRYVTFVDVTYSVYVRPAVVQHAICENTLKRCLPSSKKKKFEMGSLKAIADNQHVKYAIFAKYTKCVR